MKKLSRNLPEFYRYWWSPKAQKVARVYWNGDVRNFRPPLENEIDPVGAGDIFATSFFIRFRATKDPWESARFATLVAANSVTRKTIEGVPTLDEVRQFLS